MQIRQGYEQVERKDAWRFGAEMALRCLGRSVDSRGVVFKIDTPVVFTRMTDQGRIAESLWDILAVSTRGMALLEALGIEEEKPEEMMTIVEYANSDHALRLKNNLREELVKWVLEKERKDSSKNDSVPLVQGNTEQPQSASSKQMGNTWGGIFARASEIFACSSSANSGQPLPSSEASAIPF